MIHRWTPSDKAYVMRRAGEGATDAVIAEELGLRKCQVQKVRYRMMTGDVLPSETPVETFRRWLDTELLWKETR